MSNFRTLNIAMDFYHECEKLNLKGELRKQFERCSLSIVLNLSEGAGKRTPMDRRRFYDIAYGSLQETKTILMIIKETKLLIDADRLGAHLWKLMKNPGGR